MDWSCDQHHYKLDVHNVLGALPVQDALYIACSTHRGR